MPSVIPVVKLLESVDATDENKKRCYAELIAEAQQAALEGKPLSLMVWHGKNEFTQQAVDLNENDMASLVIGLMSYFPSVFDAACQYIVDNLPKKGQTVQ